MKKLISIIISLNFLLLSLSVTSFALNESEVKVSAKSAVLMDFSTGEILYSLNENERLYPASVTKIMPMLIFMEELKKGTITLDETVKTSRNASSKGGSQIWLKEGETMSVNDLLKATAIGSANDAVTSLGEHISGSETAFVELMNEKAKALGMKNTTFENCSGLDDDTKNHFSTAYDIALMSRELLKHKEITKYTTVWMDTLRGGETQLVNTNKLVRFYEGTTGLKTGTTSRAGYCLSASAERGGLHLIAVIMGADSSNERFDSAKALLNWGFSKFETVTPEIDHTLLKDVRVLNGVSTYVSPTAEEVKPITLEKGMKERITTEISLSENIEAPCEENQRLGTITFKVDGKRVGEVALKSKNPVERINFGVMLLRFLKVLSKSL